MSKIIDFVLYALAAAFIVSFVAAMEIKKSQYDEIIDEFDAQKIYDPIIDEDITKKTIDSEFTELPKPTDRYLESDVLYAVKAKPLQKLIGKIRNKKND